MPNLDGTGPRGEGPFTGRGEGYCAVTYPNTGKPYGYAGIQGIPVIGSRPIRQRPFRMLRRGGGRGRWGRGRRGW
jgi:hypothetical protein